MHNPDFGNDPAEADHPVWATHICKHCPALGRECDECGGDGQGEWTGRDEDGDDEWDNCTICAGEGVIEVKPPRADGSCACGAVADGTAYWLDPCARCGGFTLYQLMQLAGLAEI
jgi:hypothetical protein